MGGNSPFHGLPQNASLPPTGIAHPSVEATMPNQSLFTKRRLVEDLQSCGFVGGDLLVVHSSLKAIGMIDGGAPTLIEAFQEVLGDEGTLMLPTFSFNLTNWQMGPYHPRLSMSRVGLLTEVFRRLPGVRRSLHPTHSVAAWGKYSEELTEIPPTTHEPLGIGSPFDRARQLGGKILLLGVGQTRNSTVHLAEHLAKLPYLDVPFSETADFDEAWYEERHGGPVRMLKIRQMPGSSEGFAVLEHLLAGKGLFHHGQVGNAGAVVMNAGDLCEAILGFLARQPDLLLRHEPGSPITRRRLEHLYKLRPDLDTQILAGKSTS